MFVIAILNHYMLAMSYLKHKMWMALGRNSLGLELLKVLSELRYGERIGVVDKKTEIVIEGFPRSANTFAVAAFLVAQQRSIRIAHHVHGPAQITLAQKYGIPAIVLIRNPLDAITSLLIRQPYVKVKYAFENYLRFYEALLPVRRDFVIASFEDVIADFGQIIHRVNRVFGVEFHVFQHSDEILDRVYELVEEMDRRDTGLQKVSEVTVARPSVEREKRKAVIREQLLDVSYKGLIDQAMALYQDYLLYSK